MRPQPAGLWRNPDFLKFWVGQSISFFGSEVTALALPLTAVLILQATPAQMGSLVALRNLPFIFVGLLAGVWVDRMRRRPLLIGADLGNALLLGSIPAAYIFGWLSMEHLYVVTFLAGTIFVISMVAYQSFIPSLVQRQQLVEGNSKLEVSSSVAGIVGPGLAGVLVQLVTAPIAILVDGASFLVSALFLGSIRTPEPPPIPHDQQRNVWGQIAEGMRRVIANPLLSALVRCGATHNFFSRMMEALYVLYLVRELGIDPLLLGVILACGGPGALAGALLAAPAAKRLGLGPTIVWMQVLTGVARLCIPLAGGPLPVTVGLLMLGEFLLGVARPIFNVNQVSLRQSITPDRLQGRVNATMRFIMWSVTPVGALVGGVLGSIISLRTTLLLAATGVLLAFLWVYFSPLRSLREQPEVRE
ncbi:MAG TPA: MFS transporter [Chloroflexia bacterium]|jgi:predicted MFS family arabinose efflux permease